MDKLKRIWNLALVPTAFFLGAINMWIGETGVGCMFILFATNESINKDMNILDRPITKEEKEKWIEEQKVLLENEKQNLLTIIEKNLGKEETKEFKNKLYSNE